MSAFFDHSCLSLLTNILHTLLNGAALAAGLWLALRIPAVHRSLSPSTRYALWWLVCLRMLIGLLPLPAIHIMMPAKALRWIAPANRSLGVARLAARPLHYLTAPAPSPIMATSPVQTVANPNAASSAAAPAQARGKIALASHPRQAYRLSPSLPMPRLLVLIWLIGVMSLLACYARGAARIGPILRESPEAEPSHPAMVALREVRASLRCRRLPRVLVHPGTAGPMLALDSRLRSVIVVPAGCAPSLSTEQLRGVMAHELAHLKRGDLWLSLIPALCRSLLWFAPPAWLAARECLTCAEEACDAAAARATGGTPAAYSEALIVLASGSTERAPLVLGAAALSPGYRSLQRRIRSLQREHRRKATPLGGALATSAVAAVACLLPAYQLSARAIFSAQTGPGDAPVYALTDLGALLPDRSVAASINNMGDVAGYAESGARYRHARGVIWRSGAVTPLPATPQYRFARATAIDDSGDAILATYNYEGWQHAALASAHGALRPLGAERAYPYSAALAVGGGQVAAGYVYRTLRSGQLQSRAALWSGSALPQDLGTLGGRYSAAYGLGAQGEVVGKADTPDGTTHAAAWQDGRVIDLGALSVRANSAAYAVSRTGVIVGYSALEGRTPHAALWARAGALPVDLGALDAGGISKARAINDAGQVVGVSTKPGGFDARAALWQGGRIYDLNERAQTGASGWALRYALGINNAGQIVGVGQVNGKTHAFLLTPNRTAGIRQ